MLELTVPKQRGFNSQTNEMLYWPEVHLTLEHSLIAISLWEAKYHKPFLNTEKTPAELIDYIRCMTVNKNVDPDVYNRLTADNIDAVSDYINDSMTATWFSEDKKPRQEGAAPPKKEVITSELIYYWMVAYQIPFECQKWHLNRLITLVRIYSEKNKEPKKMSKKEMMAQRKSLNAARRAKAKSNG